MSAKVNFEKILSDIIATGSAALSQQRIGNRASVAKYAKDNSLAISNNLSIESDGTIGQTQYNACMDTLNNTILNIESAFVNANADKFTDVQRRAAQLIMPYAMNPKAYIEALANPQRSSLVDGINVVSKEVSPFAITSEESAAIRKEIGNAKWMDDNYNITHEAYDGQKLNNFVFFNIAYNLAAARQDDFAEAFFPTVVIDVLQSGIDLTINFTSLWKEYTHNTDGKVNKEDLERTPVIKRLYDKKVFAVDNQLLIPVFRQGENEDFFLKSQKYFNTDAGSSIETAPLVFGKEVSLLGISTTDSIAAKGEFDNTDALDRTVNLKNVYLQIAGSAADVIKVDTTIYAHNNFFPHPQGHHKDLILDFKSESIFVKPEESTSPLLKGETALKGYTLVYAIQVGGNCNTFTSETKVNAVSAELVAVYNAAGVKVALNSADAGVTALKALNTNKGLEVALVGYELRASRTNSNIRTRGQLLTVDTYSEKYVVPLRQGVTLVWSTNNQTGTDNDVSVLAEGANLAGQYVTNSAIKELLEFDNKMNYLAQSSVAGVANVTGHISGWLVNAWYSHTALDVSTLVNSIQSSNLEADVRAALRTYLFKTLMDMYVESNYGIAYQVMRGNVGGKVGVVVGTDPLIASLLLNGEATFSLGEQFDVRVVSTLDPDVKNKIFVTFSVFDENRNVAPNALNFGNCFWSPVLAYKATITRNNATSDEFHSNPRYLHTIHLPILASFEITDIMNVFNGKISLNVNKING